MNKEKIIGIIRAGSNIDEVAEEIHKLYEGKLRIVEIDLKHLNTKIQSFRSANSKPDDSCLLNWKEHINQIRDIVNPPKQKEE